MRGAGEADASVVLDALAIAVIVTDGAGIVTGWNRAAEELFGWSVTEAEGERITDLIVPSYDVEAAAGILASVSAGTDRAGEFACCRKDGTQIWIHSTLSPIRKHGRVVAMVGSSLDISERRAANIRVGSLLQHASDIAFIVNVDGSFKYVSPVFERAFGYEPGAMIGELGYDFVHSSDRPKVARAIAAAAADPSAHPVVVYRGRTEDGS
jgi:PAS domain S-box-containing protein